MNANRDLLAIPGMVFVLAFIALWFWWHFSRSNTILLRWAERNGLRIIRKEYRTFLKGPFFWTTSKGQTVYRVTVEDEKGQRRHGWVRCGGWWLGLWSDAAQVRWDGERPVRPTPQPKADGSPLWDRDIDG